MRILAGSASKELGARIAMNYGTPLCATKHTVFSDGEFRVSIEETVRGKEVVIVQSTFPPSDNLMELLIMVDAVKRASAEAGGGCAAANDATSETCRQQLVNGTLKSSRTSPKELALLPA